MLFSKHRLIAEGFKEHEFTFLHEASASETTSMIFESQCMYITM